MKTQSEVDPACCAPAEQLTDSRPVEGEAADEELAILANPTFARRACSCPQWAIAGWQAVWHQ
jgi:hypothetical protein